MLDWVLHDRSYGSVLVTEMVWIRPGRVDLCLGIEMGIKREQKIIKKWVERERACVCIEVS